MMPSRPGTPSRNWQERIDPDEGPRFERYAQLFAQMQRAQSAKFGPGRALHRRQLLALRAQFEVLEGLPVHARHGLFARAGRYDAWIRLSNGASSSNPDRRADVRGFALKVLGVRGPGALGTGETECQDFLLIQLPATGFARSAEFVDVALAAAKGPLAVIGALVRRHGLLGGLRRLKRIGAGLKAPFSGFATERFYSALPFASGPYAVRARLLPPAAEVAAAGAQDGWAQDLAERLRLRPLTYEFQLQFFVDEATTPIEDGSVDWVEAAAPYLTVARLTLPQQVAEPAFAARVEAAHFDPWAALAEHRPLGELMRARKVVYYTSQQGRSQLR